MRLCSPWILSVVSMVMFASVGVSQGPRPRAEWVFEESRLSGGTLRASIGGAHATVHGVLTFQEGSHWQAGVFTGSTGSTIELDYRPGKKPLPRQSITAEAWVKLDAGGQWGGMVSVLQDNGAFEKGWLLGFYKNRFCFALSSVGADDGDGLMTYMAADKAFSTKGWHHVAGTYNGKKMRLFVDGSLAKESEVQSGAILYPKRAKFVLGAYRDDNEHYPIKGQMRSVALWSKALTASQIKSRYKANCPPPAPEPLAGPVVRHLPDNAVSVSWRTEKLEPTAIWTGLKGESRKRFAKAGKRRDHELVLQGVT